MQSVEQCFDAIGFWEEESAGREIGYGRKNAAGNDDDLQMRQGVGRETRQGKAIGPSAEFNVGNEGVYGCIEKMGPGASIGGGHGGIAEIGQLIAEVEQQERVVFDHQYLRNM